MNSFAHTPPSVVHGVVFDFDSNNYSGNNNDEHLPTFQFSCFHQLLDFAAATMTVTAVVAPGG